MDMIAETKDIRELAEALQGVPKSRKEALCNGIAIAAIICKGNVLEEDNAIDKKAM